MNDTPSLFDLTLPKYKITKPIRLIELFAGIGSQAKALKNLNANFEHYRVCEFDKYAINSYNAVHNTNFETSDVTKIDSEWLGIVDTDKFEYILTYSFPCFTGDSLILTDKGYKRIDEIKIGDYVLTHNNEYKKVLNFFDNGIKSIYKINGMSIDEIKTTRNHKFLVRSKYKKWDNKKRTYLRLFKNPEWKEVCHITKNDYLGVAINQKSIIPEWGGIDFKWSDGRKSRHKNQLNKFMKNKDFWWLIGRYIGDGWLRYQGGIIICCDKNKTKDIEYKLKKLFNYSIYNARTTNNIHIPIKELGLFCEQFGRGASNKKLTNTIIDLPLNLLESFIEGYESADGCITNKKHRISSVSRELIYGIAQCIAKIYKTPYKIYSYNYKNKCVIENRVCNQKKSYELVYKKEKCKQDKAFYEDGYIWYPIKEIEYIGEEKVYDIEVENDHSFTVQNTIVHNCQDLSLAGNRKGMQKGNSTRSGLLWEVERLLTECLNMGGKKALPQILLMENVKQVITAKGWRDWCAFLEKLGYSNYCQILNGADYEIPQHRERAFMISILGEYSYSFPNKKPLKTGLINKEEDVDDKYYLSKKMIEYIVANNKKWSGNNKQSLINKTIASTINTGEGSRRCDASNYICKDLPENTDLKLLIKVANKQDYDILSLLRVRKLTPRECWILMGFEDEDFEKAEKVNSNAQLYKQAGNSIIVNVLMAIFKELL